MCVHLLHRSDHLIYDFVNCVLYYVICRESFVRQNRFKAFKVFFYNAFMIQFLKQNITIHIPQPWLTFNPVVTVHIMISCSNINEYYYFWRFRDFVASYSSSPPPLKNITMTLYLGAGPKMPAVGLSD